MICLVIRRQETYFECKTKKPTFELKHELKRKDGAVKILPQEGGLKFQEPSARHVNLTFPFNVNPNAHVNDADVSLPSVAKTTAPPAGVDNV